MLNSHKIRYNDAMRIVLTGGGTGGHFYPLIAVAEAIEKLTEERTLIEPDILYVGPEPFDARALSEHAIRRMESTAGKVRTYASVLNFFDFFKTAWGIIQSLFLMFRLYPDVVFSTGGYAAFPTLWAARFFMIPVVIYDADANPGRVSLWSAKFAQYIAVAHPESAEKFPKKVLAKIARTGHPIRREIEHPAGEGGHEFLKLDATVPTVFVMGGSQGARAINDAVLDALADLVTRYNVVHQAGSANVDEVRNIASVSLKNHRFENRYKAFGLLNTLALRMAAGIATVVVARAGSGTIFEVSSWGVPSILVPIPEEVSRDQTENAYSYARAGGAEVIEQKNLSPHVLSAEIDRLIADEPRRQKMAQSAKEYARPGSAHVIAEKLIQIGLSHEN